MTNHDHRAPLALKLDDTAAEQVRRSHAEAITALQGMPASGLRIITGVSLADGIATPIAHGLGRAPVWIGLSAVRGPVSTGRIEEITDAAHDRTKQIVLKATGWGAAIALDLAVI